MDDVKSFFNNQRAKCENLLKNYNPRNDTCPPNYDGTFCWPAAPCKTLAQLPCPIPDQKNKSITRWCTKNISKITQLYHGISEWLPSNTTECSMNNDKEANLLQSFSTLVDSVSRNLYYWHLKLYIYSRIGYVTSISCVLIALLIFTQLHRLQNARVRIHINFFCSIGLQKFFHLVLSLLYEHRIFLTLITTDLETGHDSSTACRVLMVLTNYLELTSFTWILMESWYFYSVICRAPYNECTTIKPLMLYGWGLPLTVIIPYVIIYSLSTDTNFCWVDVDSKTNILAVPRILTVLINLCFFVLNVRVIFIKLNCSVLHQRKMHFWKWFKSTLMLVPLFGAHDIFFCIEPWIEDLQIKTHFYNVISIVCSFQGFLVTTLYCFMNNEVKSELKRTWQNWKSKREINCKVIKRKLNARPGRHKKKLSDPNSDCSRTEFTDLNTHV